TTWARVEKDQFEAVSAFQKRELASMAAGSDFTFYPLSGPDVLYATRFFPDAKVFAFAGLEPVGGLRKPESYKLEKLDQELHAWSNAISSIFHRSFFVTGEMARQFRGQVADGILPIILLLLSRSGYHIEGVRYGHLDAGGVFIGEPEDGAIPVHHQGVEVRFRRESESAGRRLFYFSTDLGQAFETNPSFSNFLHRLGTPNTLVKSASFLLHYKKCSSLRQYILENSNLILQDDTGIPYGYFRSPGWQVQLFGQYSRPDRPFRSQFQRDLADAFLVPENVKPLGFSLGYGYRRRSSSMILARAHPDGRPP
ncbi:MAG: hypothetical protein ABIZ80_24630, partial [Bryobacteraceae bacterium]